MIGDWVYSAFSDKPCQVIGIEQYESEYVNVKVTNVTGAKDINSLSFIPLTAEILEKNKFREFGLIRSPKYGLWLEDGRTIELAKFDCGWRIWIFYNNIPMSLKYVHELQHALILCGIDKKIVL